MSWRALKEDVAKEASEATAALHLCVSPSAEVVVDWIERLVQGTAAGLTSSLGVRVQRIHDVESAQTGPQRHTMRCAPASGGLSSGRTLQQEVRLVRWRRRRRCGEESSEGEVPSAEGSGMASAPAFQTDVEGEDKRIYVSVPNEPPASSVAMGTARLAGLSSAAICKRSVSALRINSIDGLISSRSSPLSRIRMYPVAPTVAPWIVSQADTFRSD